MTTVTNSLQITLDAATNKLIVTGDNFSFTSDNDFFVGQVLRLVLSARQSGQTGFGTDGAPSQQYARHLFSHRSAVKGCPWCQGVDKKFLAELAKDLPTPRPSLDKLDL